MFELVDDVPTLESPVWQACTQNQFDGFAYRHWCDALREAPRYHRKQWEYCYILQVLATHGALAPGRRGVGYGVGKEPLAAVLCKHGCEIVATDQDTHEAARQGWTRNDEHAFRIEDLNDRGVCEPATFNRRAQFRVVDMNAIPTGLTGFDFTWSSCALEHLGSIDQGMRFVKNSLGPLRRGGVAVHTTELNCSSNDETLDHISTVLPRARDFARLARELTADGHRVAALNFHVGQSHLDAHVDTPPFRQDAHLKVLIGGYASTSFGLIVQKG